MLEDKNQKLFNLVIGGYGLFGCILTVTLKLSYKQRLKRQVDVTNLSRLPELFQEKINQGCLYGDFQFSCDHQSEDFLSKGVFSTYLPVENSGEEVDEQSQFKLSEQDWEQLLYLAHVDKAEAFKQYSEFYLSTNNQLYWSDTHQLSVYLNGYHESLDKKMGAKHKCSEMISEFYVESEKFNEFITRAKSYMKTNSVDLIYGTVRLIKEDRQTFLPWANKNYMCIIFNLHVEHNPESIDKAKNDFQNLIDIVLSLGGNYYLTYHKWAKKRQVISAYPQFVEFLKLKKEFDPNGVFCSDWYDHYCEMFRSELSDLIYGDENETE